MDDFDDLRLLLMPDHPTPLAIKTHTADPVPFMLFDKNNPFKSRIQIFNEESAQQGIHIEEGYRLMDFFIRGNG